MYLWVIPHLPGIMTSGKKRQRCGWKATKWQQSTFAKSEQIYTNMLGRNKRKWKRTCKDTDSEMVSPVLEMVGPGSLMVEGGNGKQSTWAKEKKENKNNNQAVANAEKYNNQNELGPGEGNKNNNSPVQLPRYKNTQKMNWWCGKKNLVCGPGVPTTMLPVVQIPLLMPPVQKKKIGAKNKTSEAKKEKNNNQPVSMHLGCPCCLLLLLLTTHCFIVPLSWSLFLPPQPTTPPGVLRMSLHVLGMPHDVLTTPCNNAVVTIPDKMCIWFIAAKTNKKINLWNKNKNKTRQSCTAKRKEKKKQTSCAVEGLVMQQLILKEQTTCKQPCVWSVS